MLNSERYIVRVANDAELPDIELFTDTDQGVAITVEGIAVPKKRNSVARKVSEIYHKTLKLFPIDHPKEAIRHAINLLKREVAEHFSKKAAEGEAIGAHAAILKFAWDDANDRVVVIGDSDGGVKNYAFQNKNLSLLQDEVPLNRGDIFMQCSPGIISNVDHKVMNEILAFRAQNNLSLEEVRQLLVQSAFNNLERLHHTPLYKPRDMSVILFEVGSGHPVSGPSSETPGVQPPEPEKQFDFSDLYLPETASQDDALITLQKVRNRLHELGYESKVKPHRYAELPKAGNLQRVVKRAHDILEAEELKNYLKSNINLS